MSWWKSSSEEKTSSPSNNPLGSAPQPKVNTFQAPKLAPLPWYKRIVGYQDLPNPGKYEDLNKEARYLFGGQENFDGYRVEVSRTFSESLSTTHTWTYGGANEPPNFAFTPLATIYGVSFWARLTTDAMMQGRVISIGERFGFSIGGAYLPGSPFGSNASGEIDFKHKDVFVQFKAQTPSIFGFTYCQAMSKKLAVGFDSMMNASGGMSHASIGMRYENEDGNRITSASFSLGQIGFNYIRKASDQLYLGTEFNLFGTQEGIDSYAAVGLGINFIPCALKINLATNGKVSTFYEESISGYSKMSMCLDLDFWKGEHKLGYCLGLSF